MAILIAVAVVAFLFWLQTKKGARRGNLPSPAERIAVADRPFPDTPRAMATSVPQTAPDERTAAIASVPVTTARTAYAFASQPSSAAVDRTAGIARLARGKGLCSPRRMPS